MSVRKWDGAPSSPGARSVVTPSCARPRSNDNAKRKSLDSNAIVFGTPKGGNLDKDRLQSLYGDCIKLANENKITQVALLPPRLDA